MNPICIIDDQPEIGSAVSGILQDEGYEVAVFQDAESFYQSLEFQEPSLVLLDIWLPGVDGMELLKQLRNRFPTLPVIMMSGHAGIETAVSALKIGASDFMEKPLHLDVLLDKVEAAIKYRPVKNGSTPALHLEQDSGEPDSPVADGAVELVTSSLSQKTIGDNIVLNGVGLLSGRRTGIIISPLGVGQGIVFQTLEGLRIPGHITCVENYCQNISTEIFSANSTTLVKGRQKVRTVEHLLAALSIHGITNALIKVDEEIPNIDGSAKDFNRLINVAGVVDQSVPADIAVIRKKIGIGQEESHEKHLYAEPYDGFEIVMRVDYPQPIGEQVFVFNPDKQHFTDEIAPARSFNTFENIDMAQRLGKVGSGYLNSHIIMHEGKVINTELRFEDEFVRHKILDLIGDLYLLGHLIKGRITANMTSHGYNQAFVGKLFQTLQNGKTPLPKRH